MHFEIARLCRQTETEFGVLTNRASNVFGSWCGLSTVSSSKSKKSASYSPSLPDENPMSSNFRLFSFPFEKWNSRSSISSIWRGVNVILSFSWSYSKSCGYYDDVIRYESWLLSFRLSNVLTAVVRLQKLGEPLLTAVKPRILNWTQRRIRGLGVTCER